VLGADIVRTDSQAQGASPLADGEGYGSTGPVPFTLSSGMGSAGFCQRTHPPSATITRPVKGDIDQRDSLSVPLGADYIMASPPSQVMASSHQIQDLSTDSLTALTRDSTSRCVTVKQFADVTSIIGSDQAGGVHAPMDIDDGFMPSHSILSGSNQPLPSLGLATAYPGLQGADSLPITMVAVTVTTSTAPTASVVTGASRGNPSPGSYRGNLVAPTTMSAPVPLPVMAGNTWDSSAHRGPIMPGYTIPSMSQPLQRGGVAHSASSQPPLLTQGATALSVPPEHLAPGVLDAIELLRGAGLLSRVSSLGDSYDPEASMPNYDIGLKWKGLTHLDHQVPLPMLQRDIRDRFPELMAAHETGPVQPASLSLAQLGVDRPQSQPNLPLHHTVMEWLDLHTSVLGGKHSSGRVTKPYMGKSLPKAPSLSTGRYLPSDTPNFLEAPLLPEGWHRLVRDQSRVNPVSIQLPVKDFMSFVDQAAKDLVLISDMDWLLAGSTSLLTQVSSNLSDSPQLQQQFTFLQRYMLELSRDLEVLERHSTARYANLIWRLRDCYLARLHPSVPESTRIALRGSSLNDDYLFNRDLVVQASGDLKGDVLLEANTKSLQSLQKPQSTRRPARGGKRTTYHSEAARPKQPKQAHPSGAQPARGGRAPYTGGRYQRGNSRGRGRGHKGKSV